MTSTPNLDKIRRSVNVADKFFGRDVKPDDVKTNFEDIQKILLN